MSEPVRILLFSPDLMIASRIAGLGPSANAGVETLGSLTAERAGDPIDIALVDLQGFSGTVAELLAQVRSVVAARAGAAGRPTRIVAFGPHVAKQRLDDALAAGADEAVSRGELLGAFPALVSRWSQPARR
jgi:hypothetical protein